MDNNNMEKSANEHCYICGSTPTSPAWIGEVTVWICDNCYDGIIERENKELKEEDEDE